MVAEIDYQEELTRQQNCHGSLPKRLSLSGSGVFLAIQPRQPVGATCIVIVSYKLRIVGGVRLGLFLSQTVAWWRSYRAVDGGMVEISSYSGILVGQSRGIASRQLSILACIFQRLKLLLDMFAFSELLLWSWTVAWWRSPRDGRWTVAWWRSPRDGRWTVALWRSPRDGRWTVALWRSYRTHRAYWSVRLRLLEAVASTASSRRRGRRITIYWRWDAITSGCLKR